MQSTKCGRSNKTSLSDAQSDGQMLTSPRRRGDVRPLEREAQSSCPKASGAGENRPRVDRAGRIHSNHKQRPDPHKMGRAPAPAPSAVSAIGDEQPPRHRHAAKRKAACPKLTIRPVEHEMQRAGKEAERSLMSSPAPRQSYHYRTATAQGYQPAATNIPYAVASGFGWGAPALGLAVLALRFSFFPSRPEGAEHEDDHHDGRTSEQKRRLRRIRVHAKTFRTEMITAGQIAPAGDPCRR